MDFGESLRTYILLSDKCLCKSKSTRYGGSVSNKRKNKTRIQDHKNGEGIEDPLASSHCLSEELRKANLDVTTSELSEVKGSHPGPRSPHPCMASFPCLRGVHVERVPRSRM